MTNSDRSAREAGIVDDCYLGDGVYASFDGYHIWLDLRAQDNTTRIATGAASPDRAEHLCRAHSRCSRRRAAVTAPADHLSTLREPKWIEFRPLPVAPTRVQRCGP